MTACRHCEGAGQVLEQIDDDRPPVAVPCPLCAYRKVAEPVLQHGEEVLLAGWTIYKHPKDHPKHWVVRRWWTIRGWPDPVHSREALLCNTLEQARGTIPPDKYNIGRQEKDDPVIFEIWI